MPAQTQNGTPKENGMSEVAGLAADEAKSVEPNARALVSAQPQRVVSFAAAAEEGAGEARPLPLKQELIRKALLAVEQITREHERTNREFIRNHGDQRPRYTAALETLKKYLEGNHDAHSGADILNFFQATIESIRGADLFEYSLFFTYTADYKVHRQLYKRWGMLQTFLIEGLTRRVEQLEVDLTRAHASKQNMFDVFQDIGDGVKTIIRQGQAIQGDTNAIRGDTQLIPRALSIESGVVLHGQAEVEVLEDTVHTKAFKKYHPLLTGKLEGVEGLHKPEKYSAFMSVARYTLLASLGGFLSSVSPREIGVFFAKKGEWVTLANQYVDQLLNAENLSDQALYKKLVAIDCPQDKHPLEMEVVQKALADLALSKEVAPNDKLDVGKQIKCVAALLQVFKKGDLLPRNATHMAALTSKFETLKKEGKSQKPEDAAALLVTAAAK